MGRYVVENCGRKISLFRPHDRMSVQIRLEPGDIYTDLYDLDENDLNYYRQLVKNGLHLMKYGDYLRKEGKKEELEEYLAENSEVENSDLSLEEEDDEVTEEEDIDEEVAEEEETEEDIDEETDEEGETEEPLEEDNEEQIDMQSDEEDNEEEITEQKLKEMSEDEVRDLGEELGVGNYWNKKLDTLAKDILSELKE